MQPVEIRRVGGRAAVAAERAVGLEQTPIEDVLLGEVVEGLNISPGDVVVDATVGTGGHAEAIAKRLGASGTLVAIDVDELSLSLSRKRLSDAPGKVIYVRGNFRHLKDLVEEAGVQEADGVVFDLGWHALQLRSGKGLSFASDEPLLMTLASGGEEARLTAKDIIADWDEEEIAKLIREYGEERFSGRIARAIVTKRKEKPIETARELAEVIARSVPAFYRHGRLHPATRTFQALRIAVNDELESLKEGLEAALEILSSGGRVATITFHSLEDRIVKHAFRDAEKEGKGTRITKKPIVPGREEMKQNPRARSAKLRIFEKHHETK